MRINRFPAALLFSAGLLGSTGGPVQGQEIQGADSILKRLNEQAADGAKDAVLDPVTMLQQKVKAFEDTAADLSPEKAATQWLDLFDAYSTLSNEVLYSRRNSGEHFDITALITALPPPTAWDALAAALDARTGDGQALRDEALRLLAAVLRGDGESRRKAVAALKAAVKGGAGLEDYEKQHYEQMVGRVAEALDALAGSPAQRTAAFEAQLATVEKSAAGMGYQGLHYLQIPDLVADAGEAKAKALLRRALRIKATFSIEGKRTRRLAGQIALDHVDELQTPPWDLVETAGELPLYEALAKKFPDAKSGSNRQEADAVYLLTLIAKGRTEDAAAFARKASAATPQQPFALRENMIAQMQQQGLGAQVLAFLRQMLKENPQLPMWRSFIELSAHQAEAEEALELLRQALTKEGLDAASRSEIHSHYYRALLAADEVEEGLRVLRELIKAGPRKSTSDGENAAAAMREQWERLGVAMTPEMLQSIKSRSFGEEDTGDADHIKAALQLAALGRLLEKPELEQEGLAAATATFLKMAPASRANSYSLPDIVEALLQAGQIKEAETLVAGELVELMKQKPELRASNLPLTSLLYIYHHAGRPADVVRLLEDAPLWGVPDLAQLDTANFNGTPLLLMAAQALAAVGKQEIARAVIHRAVQTYPANDAVYEQLLAIGGNDVEAVLDRVRLIDRFQERPLIWKAHLKLKSGALDEAEKIIRAAIAIDPSDGEQGKGDRMRAYAVLAEILEKKGDAAQAKVMRGAVQAIRLSETADEWWNSGLLSRAVKIYEEALLHFADAYCIQSRLALRYSELGDFAKAERHYHRAFELMPESFGRVESHCFGCEGAFSGERAQGIADNVFSQLAKKMPDRAQVFYLLGYLRNQQGRKEEAAEQYRHAVKLDPDYLNAWKKLAELHDDVNMSPEEHESAALALFRLDPTGRHAGQKLQGLTDLRRVWAAILAAEETLPETDVGPLVALPASKAALSEGADRFITSPTFLSRRMDLRRQFSQNTLIKVTTQLLEMVARQG